MRVSDIGPWFKRTYDKLAAAVILLVLLGALIRLAMDAQTRRDEQALFDQALKQLTPKHAKAVPVDKKVFDAAYQALREPLQITVWSNHVVAPELRVWCVNCERPIPYDATNCPFCRVAQPVQRVTIEDKDRDLMPDEWEVKYRLNPLDPDDADADPDQDGFTNLEEYNWKTDPRDSNSHPPYLAKIRLVEIKPIPFSLIFKGVSTLEGGVKQFQVNLRKGGRTFFAKLGEEVGEKEKEKFKVIAYDEKTAEGKPILTLQRGVKTIRLIRDQVVPHNEYEIVLFNGLDKSEIRVQIDSQFEVKGVKYGVKSVDTAGSRVLIHDPVRNTDDWIGRQVQPAQPASQP
jgi:hypothetical protein